MATVLHPRGVILSRCATALLVVIASAACAAQTSGQPPAAGAQTATPTAAVAAAPSRPSVTAAPGRCTDPKMSTSAVIERYFDLSTRNDPQAVADCFAKEWRERNATGVNVNAFADAATRWSSAGPASDLVIRFLDAVNGCDRYAVSAKMASGLPIGQGGSEFIAIGADAGTPRIFEVTTALVNTTSATTACR